MNDWDCDLMRDIFIQEDVEKILKIPISLMNQEDKWIWLGDNKGQYTVKSGYRVLSRAFPQFYVGNPSFNWLKLWNLAIPPTLKNFVWRVLHECLPTLENLRRRFVDVQPLCGVCKLTSESLEHIFLTCPFANRCWGFSSLIPCHTLAQTIPQLFVNIFDILSIKDLKMLCSVMWSIWNHRNSVVWNNRNKTCSQVTNKASSTLFQWQQAQVTQNRQSACYDR